MTVRGESVLLSLNHVHLISCCDMLLRFEFSFLSYTPFSPHCPSLPTHITHFCVGTATVREVAHYWQRTKARPML
jgi:hypothetical protein